MKLTEFKQHVTIRKKWVFPILCMVIKIMNLEWQYEENLWWVCKVHTWQDDKIEIQPSYRVKWHCKRESRELMSPLYQTHLMKLIAISLSHADSFIRYKIWLYLDVLWLLGPQYWEINFCCNDLPDG